MDTCLPGPRCAAVKCPKASASSLGALSLLMRQGIQPRGSKPSFPKAPRAPCSEVAAGLGLPSIPRAALNPPLAHVEDEEAEGADSYGSNLLPVPREAVPLVLVLIEGSGGGQEEEK